jgi:hypothetical protein
MGQRLMAGWPGAEVLMKGINGLIEEVLGSPPPARGRRPTKPLYASITRQLTQADIQALWDVPEGGLKSQVSTLQRLRSSHHMLAKILADGVEQNEASLITGYSPSYISNIKNEPMFQELVTHYTSMKAEVYLNVHERLASLGLDVVEELQERLATSPQDFGIRDLKEIGELALDRSGHGPTSSVKHQHNVALVAPDQLDRIKNEVRTKQVGRAIPLAPNSSGPPVGVTIDGEAVLESEIIRIAGEGIDVSEEGK